MKIVCDACQAKYSISDDKVQGKVFKIRCKKCSNIIVVRGGAGATEAPAPAQEKDTRVYDYGYDGGGEHPPGADEQVWHVVINQDQVGPMTVAEVHQRFSAGEIDAESYIWREGFADWLPLSQVDVFASLASAAPAGGGHDAVSSMFGGGGGSLDDTGTSRSDPGDLFAAASGGRGEEHDDGGGDLFAAKPSAAQAKDAANSKMRGERNENSVLFSLNNLAQLASDKPAPMMSSPSSAGNATGAAGGEGSGLIDIRSMANAYLGNTGGGAQAKTSTAIGSIDDLPVFGGGGFSEPAVIVPTARAANNNKLMYALIGSIGLFAVVAVIMIVVLMRGGKPTPAVVAVADNGSGSAAADPTKGPDTANPAVGSDSAKTPDPTKTPDPAAAKTPDPAAAKTPDPAAAKAPDPAKTPDQVAAKTPDPKKTPVTPIKKTATPPAPHDSKQPVKVAASDPKPPPPEKAPKADPGGGGGCDEVSCVLNNYEGACCSKFRKGGSKTAPTPAAGGDPAPKPHSDLPDSLDRTMISDGVGKVKARVMACGDKSPAKGQVKVSVKVGADGHVAGVTVKTTPDPALGNCVAAAMQRATFAKTQSGGSFGYPFVF